MVNILLYISSFLLIFSFFSYLILIMLGRNKIVTKCSGFDVTKDIISKYNMINVIESKSYFTFYNIKRKVIKLNTKCYYGNDLASICLCLIEAGISVLDNSKNKYINTFRNIFSNLKMLYIFPVISLFISNSSFNISDVKVSIILILLFCFIFYIVIDVKSQAYIWISDNLKKIKYINKDNYIKIMNFIDKLILLDKFIFYSQIIMIIRLMFILFGMN